ncbi:MAG: hypothetical protein AB7F86_03790 [Bdellovibrionales bacterium]
MLFTTPDTELLRQKLAVLVEKQNLKDPTFKVSKAKHGVRYAFAFTSEKKMNDMLGNRYPNLQCAWIKADRLFAMLAKGELGLLIDLGQSEHSIIEPDQMQLLGNPEHQYSVPKFSRHRYLTGRAIQTFLSQHREFKQVLFGDFRLTADEFEFTVIFDLADRSRSSQNSIQHLRQIIEEFTGYIGTGHAIIARFAGPSEFEVLAKQLIHVTAREQRLPDGSIIPE